MDGADTKRCAREAAAAGYAVVVAAGGDGTVNAVAEGLRGSATALGILPLGTANDLARELGIPRTTAAAAGEWLAEGEPRAMDLGAVGGRVFCGVGGIALVARATLSIARFAQRSAAARWGVNLLGGGVYRASAAAALIGRWEIDDTIHIAYRPPNGEPRELTTRASALFVTNHRTLGGGMVLPVAADATDGVLELCVVPARPRLSLMLNFARLSAGRPIPAGVLVPLRMTEATIETGRDDAFVADGELLATGRTFQVGVLPNALRIIARPA